MLSRGRGASRNEMAWICFKRDARFLPSTVRCFLFGESIYHSIKLISPTAKASFERCPKANHLPPLRWHNSLHGSKQRGYSTKPSLKNCHSTVALPSLVRSEVVVPTDRHPKDKGGSLARQILMYHLGPREGYSFLSKDTTLGR